MWQNDLNRLCLIQWWVYFNLHIPRLEGASSQWYFLSQELQFRLAFLVSTTLRLNYCNRFLRNLIYLIQTFLLVRGFQKAATAQKPEIPKKEPTVWKQNIITKKSSEFQPEQVFGHKQTPLVLRTKSTWKVTKVFVWWPTACSQWS